MSKVHAVAYCVSYLYCIALHANVQVQTAIYTQCMEPRCAGSFDNVAASAVSCGSQHLKACSGMYTRQLKHAPTKLTQMPGQHTCTSHALC